MSVLTRESIQHHCRTCLTDLETKVDEMGLPRLWYHVETTRDLASWIHNCTSLRVLAATKEYPQFVCQECYEKFKDFRDFKEAVWKAADKLDKVLADNLINEAPIENVNALPKGYNKCIKSEQQSADEDEEDDIFNSRQNNLKWTAESELNSLLADSNVGSAPFTELRVQDKFEVFDTELISPNVYGAMGNSSEGESSSVLSYDVPKATKSYKCAQCNRSYIHEYTYKAHIRQDHQGIERAFECDHCHKSYTKFCNLYRHMRLEHNMSLRQFKCEFPKCNRSFRQLATRRKHYQEFHHSANKRPPTPPSPPDSTLLLPELLTTSQIPLTIGTPKRFICCLCHQSFETLYNLKNHMVLHRDDMKFICTICGKRKISQMKLDEHYATVHDPKNAYPCNICHKVFKCKSHVSVHITSVHKGLRPYACHYCPSHFAARNTLKIHERIHTGEKPFACEVCGRRFTQLTPMKKHRLTHEKELRKTIAAATTSALANFAFGNSI